MSYVFEEITVCTILVCFVAYLCFYTVTRIIVLFFNVFNEIKPLRKLDELEIRYDDLVGEHNSLITEHNKLLDELEATEID